MPAPLLQALAEHEIAAQQSWQRAREADDFNNLAPALEKMMALNRELAEAIGYDDHPFDAMLKLYEPGMISAALRSFFKQLKAGFLPPLEVVRSRPEPRWDFLTRDYPVDKRREAALSFAALPGFDFSRGRLDESTRPFDISFTRQDVQMTTCYRADYLPMSLFGTLHETGHALYEQGAGLHINGPGDRFCWAVRGGVPASGFTKASPASGRITWGVLNSSGSFTSTSSNQCFRSNSQT